METLSEQIPQSPTKNPCFFASTEDVHLKCLFGHSEMLEPNSVIRMNWYNYLPVSHDCVPKNQGSAYGRKITQQYLLH